MGSTIVNQPDQDTKPSIKHRVAPWATALLCAISIHILILNLMQVQQWFDIDTPASQFEMLLLPTQPEGSTPETPKAITETTQYDTANDQDAPSFLTPDIESTQPAPNTQDVSSIRDIGPINEVDIVNDNITPDETTSSLTPSTIDSSKPALLDLSNISLSADTKDTALVGVFSEELRNKISASKEAQKEYLKGLTKEVDYPITKDADGTRYVNIKGVCWRLPPEGSNEGWAIVFDGCGVKSDLFHFELNISPSVLTNELLGPDSPFNLNQPTK
ncbi:hypothetical protein N5P32_10215 [Marinomonas pontica]|uniref:hypothetical protein n=1 Tax=Marinomonas pontica TaxID=264739 RepID=UPI0022430808|nr:hypothetical protein [Marinomonas pontica]MCW8356253.1 hypothetical protein [Marinomonas pontica]